MTTDQIIGISVLQPIWIQGFYRLWVSCRRKDGAKNQTWLFVRDRDRTDLPQTIPNQGTRGMTWRFRRNGQHLLVVEPSLNWVSWGFHNESGWTTEFIELAHREQEGEFLADNLPTRYIGGRVHHELNLCQCQEDVDRYLDELEHFGALWKE